LAVTLLPLAWFAGTRFIGGIYSYRRYRSRLVRYLHKLTPVRFHEIIALALVTALTVIYLAYLRTKFYFSTRWLIAAVTYNFFLLFVKFIISVNEFSSQSAKTFNALLYTAFLISLLYILAFGVLYLFFDGKILNKSLHKALIVSAEGKILWQ